jgi:cation diffusion facilitator family transporter
MNGAMTQSTRPAASHVDHDHGHDHSHQEDTEIKDTERRTRLAAVLVSTAMLVELIGGRLSGSLALMADGLHLAGDLGVLLFSSVAYWFARTRARSGHFTFGTGKVQVLAGYTNGVLLTAVSLGMLCEAAERLFRTAPIDYPEAMTATAFGLAISLGNTMLLGPATHAHHHAGQEHAVDHTWRAVYLHVLSDVMTNALTLGALFIGSCGGPAIFDAIVAAIASVIVLRWGLRLCRDAAWPLLDAAAEGPAPEIRRRLEAQDGVQVRDLRLWSLGSARYGCLIVLTQVRARPVRFYRDLLRDIPHMAHLFIEISEEGRAEDPSSVVPPHRASAEAWEVQ